MNEKIKFIGGVDFEELKAQRVKIYDTIDIALDQASDKREMAFVGNYLYMLEATDIDTSISVCFNEVFNGLIPMQKGRGIRTPFYRFYLTNAAQPGKTVKLGLGVESDTFEVFDVGKALEISGIIQQYEQNLGNDWATEGLLTNPGANALLADTGQLDAGIYDFDIVLTGDTSVSYSVEHRNAANDATLKDQYFYIVTTAASPRMVIRGYSIAQNERLRAVVVAAFTGHGQASIIWNKRQ